MTGTLERQAIVGVLDESTETLVRLAAVIAVSDEPTIRTTLAQAAVACDPVWVEELLLQSYLFAGFPRALNATREWRRISGRKAPETDEGSRIENAPRWQQEGEGTCATVYGQFYEPLRRNIRDLHPALDEWMIVDGYGKVLSRPGLDLPRRELCIVAVCAAAGQDRQLHSHFHGALNAGATPEQVSATLAAICDLLTPAAARRYDALWARVSAH